MLLLFDNFIFIMEIYFSLVRSRAAVELTIASSKLLEKSTCNIPLISFQIMALIASKRL